METLSILSLSLALLSMMVILSNIGRKGQPMMIMNVVWPLTALWAGVLALWAYFSFGKSPDMPAMKKPTAPDMQMKPGMKMEMEMNPDMHMNMASGGMNEARPFWQKVALSTFHCGAGCTLADLIGETAGRHLLVSAGMPGLGWQWGLDYALALLIGAYFQYAAIRPMSPGQPAARLFSRALKIDFLSLTAWQAGMYLFSYLVFFVWRSEPYPHASFGFWYIMQLAMCAGFLFSYPVNWLLVKKGVKAAM